MKFKLLIFALLLFCGVNTFSQIKVGGVGVVNQTNGVSQGLRALNLSLSGITTNSSSLNAKALGATGNGIANDTFALSAAISSAVTERLPLDLGGATYLVSSFTVSGAVTIRNGTIKAFSALTNTTPLISISSDGAEFQNVTVDGDNKVLRVLETSVGVDFKMTGGKVVNAKQPQGLALQGWLVGLRAGTARAVLDNVTITNATSGTNLVVGDDWGTMRNVMIFQSGSEVFPDVQITRCYIGGNTAEDGDLVALNGWDSWTGEVNITLDRCTLDVSGAWRGVKAIGSGVRVSNCAFVNTGIRTSYAAISFYGSGNQAVDNQIIGGAYAIGIDIAATTGNISDNLIEGNTIIPTGNLSLVEGIRVVGTGSSLVYNTRVIGNTVSNEFIGMSIRSGGVGSSFIGNISYAAEHCYLDGNRYSGDDGATNILSQWKNNYYNSTSGRGLRLKRTLQSTEKGNFGKSFGVLTTQTEFDLGASVSLIPEWVYGLNIDGGSLTNASRVKIGTEASTSVSGKVPDMQITASSTEANAMWLMRYFDSSSKNRMIYSYVDGTGAHLNTSQATGGTTPLDVSVGGINAFGIDTAGSIHAGLSGSGSATILTTRTDMTNNVTANIRWYGGLPNDSTGDDAALTSALAAADVVVFPKGTWDLASSVTISASKKIVLQTGAILKPASGIIITFDGELEAGEVQCINETAGGRVIFSATSSTREVKSPWWGADVTGGSDSTTQVQKWLYSGVAGQGPIRRLTPGSYRVTDELVVSNRWRVLGDGQAGRSVIVGAQGSNKGSFRVRASASDVEIGFIQFSASSSSGTNTFGVWVEAGSSKLFLHDCRFASQFGGGINFDSSLNTSGALYPVVINNWFLSLHNTVAAGGNGLFPAYAIRTTNVFSAGIIGNNNISSCDAAYYFHGGTITNSGRISIMNDRIEGIVAANSVWATNAITADSISQLDITGGHIENNEINNLIYAVRTKQVNLDRVPLSGDYGGTVKSTNSVYLDSVWTANVMGGRFNNTFSNYVVNLNSASPVRIVGTYFDVGAASPTTEAIVRARIVGPVVLQFLGNMNFDTLLNNTLTVSNAFTALGTVSLPSGSVAGSALVDTGVTYAKIQNVSATKRALGRNTAGAGPAEEVTASQILDWLGSAAQGDVLARGASTWTLIPAGTSGQYFKTLGTGANPLWADLTGAFNTATVNYVAYNSGTWQAANQTNVPTMKAVSEKIEALSSGSSVFVNGSSVSSPNFANSATATVTVGALTNITVNPTNLANAQIAGGAGITKDKLENSTAVSVVGRSANSSGVAADIAAGANGQVLMRSNNVVSFQGITDAQVGSSAAITRSKMASGTADHVLINDSTGAMSSEATLAKARGGFAADNSNGFSVSGTNGSLKGVFTANGAAFTNNVTVADDAYDATGWDGNLAVPTKNAIRDLIEGTIAGGVSDTAFSSAWNGVTTIAPSKNAVYDWAHSFDTDDDGKVNVLDMGAGIVKTDSGGNVSPASAGTDYVAPSGAGSVSGLTAGTIPKAASATTLADSPILVVAVTNITITGGASADNGVFTNGLKVGSGTGPASISSGAISASNLSGDVTTSGSMSTTIANDAVTNAKLANMANATIKGRNTAGTGDPEDLTALPFAIDLSTSAASGTLAAARMPALTGDITTSAGAVATTLATSGVTAGTYGNGAYIPQITFDAKGRATAVTTNSVSAAVGTNRLATATTAVINSGSGETDLATYTIPASTLANNGDMILFRAGLQFTNSLNNKTLKAKYGGTTIFNSGSLAITAATDIELIGYIIRVDATHQKTTVAITSSSTATFPAFAQYSTTTETLSGTVIVKLTGQGTADNDITFQWWTVELNPGTALGSGWMTSTSTDTMTGKTYDAAGTGNVLKFKQYLPFLRPDFGEGVGAVPQTNDYTKPTFMHYKFSGSAATNANYAIYGPISVPTDLDTSVTMRARIKVRLSATETSASTFTVGVQDVADSSSGSYAGAGNWVSVSISADGSGATDDVETSAWTNLTGWAGALTPDHFMFIVLSRDGAGDSANTGIYDAELKIEYGVTQ